MHLGGEAEMTGLGATFPVPCQGLILMLQYEPKEKP